MQTTKLDPAQYEWQEINGDPASSYPIHHDMSILGYDREAGTLDLMIRFDDKGGHCHAHRHISTTSVLVLEGEQHIEDLLPDGSRVKKVRGTGRHHLTPGDPHPHMERGGPEGALVFYSHHSPDGRLYEIVDDDLNVITTVTIDSLIAAWESRR